MFFDRNLKNIMIWTLRDKYRTKSKSLDFCPGVTYKIKWSGNVTLSWIFDLILVLEFELIEIKITDEKYPKNLSVLGFSSPFSFHPGVTSPD